MIPNCAYAGNRALATVLVACLLSLSGTNLCAQSNDYQFRHLNADNGLSHNQVLCFLKDKTGFLWIGTYAGLNRFDGYNIKTFAFDPEDSTSLLHNNVFDLFEIPDGRIGVSTSSGLTLYNPGTEKFERNLFKFYNSYNIPQGQLADVGKDRSGNYWFLLRSSGINIYDAKRKAIFPLRHTADTFSIATDSVAAFACDSSSGNWIVHQNGVVEKIMFSNGNGRVTFRSDFLRKLNGGAVFNYKLMIDDDNDLWIYVSNDPQGVFHLQTSTNQFHHYTAQTNGVQLNSNIVTGIVQAIDKKLWVTTDHGGVNVIDKSTGTVQYVVNKPEDDRSIAQNSTIVAYRDNEGIIWLGTFKKGVSYYHPNLIRFSLYKHYPLSKTGLPFSDVNRFVEDDLGNLWIGTNGGGLIYFDRKKNTFKQFLHDPNNPASISSNVVVSLCIDHQKKLWVGSYFGGLDYYDGNKFTRYRNNPKNPQSFSDNSVWEIFEDSYHRLWVGTIHSGVELFDRQTNSFSHYRQTDLNSVKSNYIAAITEDKDGNIWLGTSNGVDLLDRKTGRFFHFGNVANVKGTLNDNYVLDIREDKKGRMWIATRNGLNLFDAQSKTFREFKEKDGLPHNNILAILVDDAGDLWLSTSNGLSHATLREDAGGIVNPTFRNYDETDGLQGRQFNENSAFKTKNGELIFGGANGFNIFKPGALGANKVKPQIVLSDLQIHNKSVSPNEEVNGSVVLDQSITETRSISLSPDQNVFSIEFTGISFFNPQKNQYQYMLKGFQREWFKADANARRISFTNLYPGTYEFLVKASNNDGFWNETPATLKITVLSPFWKTRTAFVLYVITVIASLFVIRKLIQIRERAKFRHEQERSEAIRVHEMDLMKIKFFTNVSHEFRTPLTLILAPIEKLIRQTGDSDQQQQFQLIQRNAKRLLNLVNQLLDFRKLEVQELRLNLSNGDIVRFIHDTVLSFSDLSEKKDIRLDFNCEVDSLETFFDQDKIEKVLFNLLSNAFKFTPEHGSVTVTVKLQLLDEKNWLKIEVRDTGIGIPEDKLDRIFERFFQTELPKSIVNQGSGIGLSITKEFVKVHGGNITVSSVIGEGTCFTVKIPLGELHMGDATQPENEISISQKPVMETFSEADKTKPALLLVEDNEDFRFYLKDNLRIEYRVLEARNGQEGLKMTLDHLPDLIVSDIMMPEMNGIELCRKIKSDPKISHTPVILLTARSAEEQKLEGLETGADDYLTKPFNFEILVLRIKNLIAQRAKFHKSFPAQLNVRASELKITSLDEQLIARAIKCVEDHVADPDFSVEDLSHELGISRAHFYKKILSLSGKSPLEFIRIIRLQQAAQLLEKSQLTVAEIAYRVGFNNPKYFARYFKEEYKVLPSVFASEKRKRG
jgi:signal transduction histidine kinase/ligand-binding sensor domain-containing protein/DNA-binding response OmpR family regulator